MEVRSIAGLSVTHLKDPRAIQKVKQEGESVANSLAILVTKPNDFQIIRYAVIASRSVGGAVQRNRCRRRLRARAVENLKRLEVSLDCVLIARKRLHTQNRGKLIPRYKICLTEFVIGQAKMNEHDPSHEADCQTCDPELSDLPKRLSNLPRLLILLVIKAYQKTVSKTLRRILVGFIQPVHITPTRQFIIYGAVKGGWMGVKRIVRCNPFNPGGFDPVP